MTVPTSDNREQYQGNDSATEFDYAFKIFQADDLVVIITASDGTETTLVRGSDYSVDGVGEESGGTVTYPLSGDPLATGETLTILREVPVVQETDLRNQGAYYPETLEDEFDRSRMIDQQLAETQARTLKKTRGGEHFDAGGARIESLGDAVADSDALTQGQMKAYYAETREILESAQQALANAGYVFVGDYAAGIELTSYNQVVRDTSGEFWRVSGSTDLPYTTTGAGLPEGGAFVTVGDAALRQELADAAQGGDLVQVTTATGAQTLGAALDSRGISVLDLPALKAIDSSQLQANQQIDIATTGRAGSFTVRVGDFTAEVSADPQEIVWVAFDDDPTGASVVAMRNYSSSNGINILWAGAIADGATDSSAAINAAISYSDNVLIPDSDLGFYVPAGSLSALSAMTLRGESKLGSKLFFGPEQLDCVMISGNVNLENLTLDGAWDGATPSQAGDLIRADSGTFIGEISIKNIKLINAKQDALRLSNVGYCSIEDTQSNVSGRIGLHLDGENSKTNTTIKLIGRNRFSDCPNGYGARVYNGHCCDLSNLICEYTAGIEVAGNENRALTFDNVYQEFGSDSNAYTFTGSGVGLTITNNFGGGKAIPNTANFLDVTMFGNSNFSSINPIQVNDLIVATIPETVTPAVTGMQSVTAATISSVPAGLYRVVCNIQTLNAASASLNSTSVYVTSSDADSAYQNNTNNFADITDSRFNSGDSNRLIASGYFSTSSSTPLYVRFGYDLSSGQIAYAGKITLERVH